MKKQKIITAKVLSVRMKNTIIVEVERKVRHPLYKKTVKRTKHFAVETAGKQVTVGDTVHITETRPMSRTKHFILV